MTYRPSGPHGEPDTPRRRRQFERKPLASFTIDVEGSGADELASAWSMLAKAGFAEPGRLNVGMFDPVDNEQAGKPSELGAWTLRFDVDDRPSTRVELSLGERVAALNDAAAIAGVQSNIAALTVGLARDAWTKFAKQVRRSGGQADLDITSTPG